MGLDKFEKQIIDHQEYFDKEPSMDHMDKFLFKLREDEDEQMSSLIKWDKSSWWIGIAASLSLLISIGWFIYQQEPMQHKQQQMGLSFELYEIKTYYTKESDKRIKEINSCSDMSANTQKLIKATENQLMKLDFNVEKIEDKLKDAAGNKRLELAYIQNLKAKSDLLNKMHNQICNKQNILTQ